MEATISVAAPCWRYRRIPAGAAAAPSSSMLPQQAQRPHGALGFGRDALCLFARRFSAPAPPDAHCLRAAACGCGPSSRRFLLQKLRETAPLSSIGHGQQNDLGRRAAGKIILLDECGHASPPARPPRGCRISYSLSSRLSIYIVQHRKTRLAPRSDNSRSRRYPPSARQSPAASRPRDSTARQPISQRRRQFKVQRLCRRLASAARSCVGQLLYFALQNAAWPAPCGRGSPAGCASSWHQPSQLFMW